MPDASCPGDDPAAILEDWYTNHYSQVTATADGSFFHSYLHRSMERRFTERDTFESVLEVGGNRGEHVPFIKHGFSSYLLTDLYEPKLLPELAADDRLRTLACDVADLPLEAEAFDRVISTCLLHHVESPLLACAELRRVAKPGAVVTILLPCDPGLTYRIGKALTSGRAARKAGIGDKYRLIGALDHRNHFLSILEQVKHVYRADDVAIEWKPWRMPGMGMNAFVVITVTKARDDGAGARP